MREVRFGEISPLGEGAEEICCAPIRREYPHKILRRRAKRIKLRLLMCSILYHRLLDWVRLSANPVVRRQLHLSLYGSGQNRI